METEGTPNIISNSGEDDSENIDTVQSLRLLMTVTACEVAQITRLGAKDLILSASNLDEYKDKASKIKELKDPNLASKEYWSATVNLKQLERKDHFQ